MHRPLLPLCLLAALAAPAGAEITVASQSYGFALVLLDTLPPAPADQGDTAFCDHLFLSTPDTPAGRDAQARGSASRAAVQRPSMCTCMPSGAGAMVIRGEVSSMWVFRVVGCA